MNTIQFLENGQICVTVAGTPFVLPAGSRPDFRNENALCVFVNADGETVLTTNTADFVGGLLNSDLTVPANATDATFYVKSFFTNKRSYSVILRYADPLVGDVRLPVPFCTDGLLKITCMPLLSEEEALSQVPLFNYTYNEGEGSINSNVGSFYSTPAFHAPMGTGQLMIGYAPAFPFCNIVIPSGTSLGGGSGARMTVTIE